MIQITPHTVQGAVAAPPSKSFSIRALMANYLSGSASTLHNLSDCEDVLTAQKLLTHLPLLPSYGLTVFPSYGLTVLRSYCLPCRESALTLHIAASVAALQAQRFSFTARGSLQHRPLDSLVHALEAFGARCSPAAARFPFWVEGPLRPARQILDGRSGSQAVSGLLMALPLLEGDSEITLLHPVSLPYIDLTLEVMRRFGVFIDVMPVVQGDGYRYLIKGKQSYRATELTVAGDWSGAAAVMAAAAVSGGKVRITGLGGGGPAVPDSIIIKVLRCAGVVCTQIESDWEISAPNGLTPFSFDLTHAPDLAPVLTALAANTSGVSVLQGADRLKTKESSRGEVLQQIFGQLGIKIELSQGVMTIYGGRVAGCDHPVESHHDHRIAMAVAVAAAGARQPVSLSGASCVAKTYPRFWDDLASLGLPIQKIE